MRSVPEHVPARADHIERLQMPTLPESQNGVRVAHTPHRARLPSGNYFRTREYASPEFFVFRKVLLHVSAIRTFLKAKKVLCLKGGGDGRGL